ncbi:MAG TPA: peptidase M48 Ste24p, partial [Sphingopyxis sp.]|nr:peptidase M48 Ste24p [Sphingopyxis sp.]
MSRKTKAILTILLATAVGAGGVGSGAEAQTRGKVRTIKTATAITANERKQGSEAHPELMQEFGGA